MMGIKRWFRNAFGRDIRTFTDDQKVEAYFLAGTQMGYSVSYIYLGECVGFLDQFEQWEKTEKAYADLGFRTLSIDDLTSAGGYGADISEKLRVPRKEGEPVVLHAAYYRKHFLHKNMVAGSEPVGDQGAYIGYYVSPSTEHLLEK